MPNKSTPAERDVALTALALNGGNLKRTAREINVPFSTLQDWRDRNPDRYAQIQNDQAPAIAERVASRSEAIAIQALEVEEALLHKAMEGIDDLKATDAAAAFRNVSTGKALQFDKLSNPIRGRGTVRVDDRDLTAILNSLERRLGLDKPVTSTAADITDADVIPALMVDPGPVNARELTAGPGSEAPSA